MTRRAFESGRKPGIRIVNWWHDIAGHRELTELLKPKEMQKPASFPDKNIQKLSWDVNEKANIGFGHLFHLFPLDTSMMLECRWGVAWLPWIGSVTGEINLWICMLQYLLPNIIWNYSSSRHWEKNKGEFKSLVFVTNARSLHTFVRRINTHKLRQSIIEKTTSFWGEKKGTKNRTLCRQFWICHCCSIQC